MIPIDDHGWLLKAIELSRQCPPTDKAAGSSEPGGLQFLSESSANLDGKTNRKRTRHYQKNSGANPTHWSVKTSVKVFFCPESAATRTGPCEVQETPIANNARQLLKRRLPPLSRLFDL